MESILIYFISATGITGALIWLGKFSIKKSFDLGIEKYKSSLQKELENYKSELMRFNYEQQIKFNKLHEERGDKIKLLYNKLNILERTLIYLTTPAQGPEFVDDINREKEAMEKLNSLYEDLDNNRIYFTDSTLSKFENIIEQSNTIISEMRTAKIYTKGIHEYQKSNQYAPEIYYEKGKLWSSAHAKTQNEFRILKLELINEFRKLLGF